MSLTDRWSENLVDDDAGLARILREARTVGVVGAKAQPSQPAHYVPAYLAREGYRVLPVNPTLAGSRIYTSLADTDEVIDEALNRFEDVFRLV